VSDRLNPPLRAPVPESSLLENEDGRPCAAKSGRKREGEGRLHGHGAVYMPARQARIKNAYVHAYIHCMHAYIGLVVDRKLHAGEVSDTQLALADER